jgi:cell division protein FtsB
MSNATNPLISEAKKLVSSFASCYGDQEYYVERARERNKMLNVVVETFEEREKEIAKLNQRIAELERRNQHLTDRVLRFALGKPQELPPVPPETAETAESEKVI